MFNINLQIVSFKFLSYAPDKKDAKKKLYFLLSWFWWIAIFFQTFVTYLQNTYIQNFNLHIYKKLSCFKGYLINYVNNSMVISMS